MKFPLIFLFLFLLVLTPMVLAQPPQATSVVINLKAGLNVDFPRIIELPQNEDFKFHFHVFNATSGLIVDNTTTNCSFELVDNNGIEIFEDSDIVFVDDEFNVIILGGNFSRLGSYFWLINCQTGSEGGFISSPLVVTADGLFFSEFPSQFTIILFAILLLIIGIFKERFRLLQMVGSMLLIIMGILTLFPGYSFINWTTLMGLALGTILIGTGFYFLLEPAFSREEQEEHFEQGGGG